jgi:hypothetical protein
MALRQVSLRIEEIAEYSPVEPSAQAAANNRKDRMRNTGREAATIPLSEINARRLAANTGALDDEQLTQGRLTAR